MSVSVIIPVFNVAPYLRSSLDALRAQTYADWTAICVDDGSTDGSGTILDEYAQRDPRFQIVHQANAGVSAARNVGLDRSRGEIVLFLDPDDSADPEWMKCLADAMEDADFAWGGFWEENAGCSRSVVPYDAGQFYSGDAVRRRTWRAVFGYRLRDLVRAFLPGGLWKGCHRELGGVWARAFRRSVIGNLRFDARLRLYEDAMFLSDYALRARSLRVVGCTGYRYFVRPCGCMTTETRANFVEHKFKLRDARREIDPRMRGWRGTYLLSALQVLRMTKSIVLTWRYLTFRSPNRATLARQPLASARIVRCRSRP